MFFIFMVTSVLFALALNAITLLAVGRLIREQRDKFDAFLGFAELGILNYSQLDGKVQSALDCLVAADAKLDAVRNPSETRNDVA